MSNAKRDENNVPTLIAASSADGKTIVPIKVGSVTHGLYASDGTSGTDYGRSVSYRDENNVPVLLGVSSADGVTPTEIYADETTGALLIQSS